MTAVSALQIGFNVELGGYFSIKRNATSINGDTWLDVEEVAPYCKAILETFRSVSLWFTEYIKLFCVTVLAPVPSSLLYRVLHY